MISMGLYHILSNSGTKLLALDNIGYSTDTTINRFGPGRRNLYLIHYVVEGKGVFNSSHLKAGQGFLIRPGQLENYYPDSEHPWTNLWVTSRDPAIDEIFEGYNADTRTMVFDYDYIPTVRNVTKILHENHERLYSPSEILEIFLHMYNKQKKASENAITEPDTYYKYAVSYIESNLYRPITVNELTSVLGISQPYLYKIFMDKCGMSPKRFILDLKCGEAKRLLAGTDMSVTEVANSVGYADVMTFSKFFRKETGMSPKAFRS